MKMSSNASIERTPSSRLRRLPVAAHVECLVHQEGATGNYGTNHEFLRLRHYFSISGFAFLCAHCDLCASALGVLSRFTSADE